MRHPSVEGSGETLTLLCSLDPGLGSSIPFLLGGSDCSHGAQNSRIGRCSNKRGWAPILGPVRAIKKEMQRKEKQSVQPPSSQSHESAEVLWELFSLPCPPYPPLLGAGIQYCPPSPVMEVFQCLAMSLSTASFLRSQFGPAQSIHGTVDGRKW